MAGYTSKLQVLDVGINKPFKDHFREKNIQFLIDRATLDVKPKRQDIARWAYQAWESISQPAILNTWRHVGISHQ